MMIPYRTAKFKSANILISTVLDQTAKFEDCQYFRPYGISLDPLNIDFLPFLLVSHGVKGQLYTLL